MRTRWRMGLPVIALACILGAAGCQEPLPGVTPSAGQTATPAPSLPLPPFPTKPPARPSPTIEIPPPRNAPAGEAAGQLRTDPWGVADWLDPGYYAASTAEDPPGPASGTYGDKHIGFRIVSN